MSELQLLAVYTHLCTYSYNLVTHRTGIYFVMCVSHLCSETFIFTDPLHTLLLTAGACLPVAAMKPLQFTPSLLSLLQPHHSEVLTELYKLLLVATE